MSVIGLAVNTGLNFLLIPRLGYMGAAWSTFAGYAVMMMLTYILGQHYFPVEYPVRRIIFVGIAVCLVTLVLNALLVLAGSLWPLVSITGVAAVCGLMAFVERKDLVPLLSRFRGRRR